MAAETGFLIDGTIYEVPTLDSLTLDESEVMYDKCGLVQEDFIQQADETEAERDARVSKLTRHPGFMASLMQIAYQRGNPDVKPGAVTLVLGKTNRLEAFSTLSQEEPAEEPVPLASTSEPNKPSSSGSLENDNSTKESDGTSGNGSATGSDVPVADLVTTGITRSDTSSTLARTVSVASGQPT